MAGSLEGGGGGGVGRESSIEVIRDASQKFWKEPT